MDMTLYALIGSILAGAYFAAERHKWKSGSFDMIPGDGRLFLFCACIVLPFWPLMLSAFIGAFLVSTAQARTSGEAD